MPGRQTCWHHGGVAGRGGKEEAIAQSDAVATIAAYVARNEHRDIGDILRDALTVNDSVMRAMRDKVARGEEVTGDDIERMIESSRASFAIANAAMRTGIMDRLAKIEEAKAAMLARCLDAALAAVPLPPAHREAIESAYLAELERAIEGEVVPAGENGRRR